MSDVQYRWLDGPTATDAEWERLESIMATRGWASLNRLTSRILLAERNAELLGYIVFQMIPYVGPVWVRPSARGEGVAEDLAKQMVEFLNGIEVRGWLAQPESAHAERLCKEWGMSKVEAPVYVMTFPFGGVDVEERKV